MKLRRRSFLLGLAALFAAPALPKLPKVYVDPLPPAAPVLTGLKGSMEMDAGLFYCPYVPLNYVGEAICGDHPPPIGFKTRYGMLT